MTFLDGYKTVIGAAFLAATFFVTGIETLLTPDTALVVKTVLGTIGTFLTGVGIAGKFDKINK